ncbi:hypothetical protein EfmAA94_15990 [Enterococcus faecium]|nr:hypothetical protein EfmAA94_15990 [Enterococcus faecium]
MNWIKRFSLDIKDPELIFNFIAFHERSYLFYGNPDLFFNRSYIEEMKEEEPRTYHIMEKLKKNYNNGLLFLYHTPWWRIELVFK